MRAMQIANIVETRKPLVRRIEQSKDTMDKTLEQIFRFRTICEEGLSQENDGKRRAELGKYRQEADSILEQGKDLRGLLEKLRNRFDRSTLNIAVVGLARQGKSRLLQTITGLSTEEIPDGNRSYCTGVRSDLLNDPTMEEAKGCVYFHTETGFLQNVVGHYLDELGPYLSSSPAPSSLEAFRAFSVPKLEDLKVDYERSTEVGQVLDHLRLLQENLGAFRDLLGRPPMWIDKGRIREFVAQVDREGKPVFFNHMAVDRVEILCRFPNSDLGALRLIDLPGLGDTKLGDDKRIIEALADQVDLVFFIHKPAASGAGWGREVTKLYATAQRGLGEKLPVEQWSFWVFNHDKKDDNRVQCEDLRSTMAKNRIAVSDSVVVDCTDPEEVETRLIDKALEYLTQNVGEIDRGFSTRVQESLMALAEQIQEMISGSKAVFERKGLDDKDFQDFLDLFSGLHKNLTAEIQKFVGGESELRKKQEMPCEIFTAEVGRLLDLARKNEPISVEMAKEIYLSRDIYQAFGYLLDETRVNLSSRFYGLDEALEKAINEMKDNLGNIFAISGKMKNKFGCKGFELLKKLRRYIDELGIASEVPNIKNALDLVIGFKMSYRGFIQHRIREKLNPLDQYEVSVSPPKSAEDAADLILNSYQNVVYELEGRFEEMAKEPNRASFAVAEDFKDLTIRALGSKRGIEAQWQLLYRHMRHSIWPETFHVAAAQGEIMRKWELAVNSINELNIMTGFIFSTGLEG